MKDSVKVEYKKGSGYLEAYIIHEGNRYSSKVQTYDRVHCLPASIEAFDKLSRYVNNKLGLNLDLYEKD